MDRPKVRVCFTPDLLKPEQDSGKPYVVVVDILRATTSMCTALANGAEAIIPVEGGIEGLRLKVEDLKLKVEDLSLNTVNGQLSTVNYLLAGESDGVKLPGVDLGNSPLEFTREMVEGKTIIFSTTNGTRAILKANETGEVFIASFVNFKAMAAFLSREMKDVTLLCSGWKGQFSLEDTLFAGKLAEELVTHHGFSPADDSAIASINLWRAVADHFLDFARMSSHYMRLISLESAEGLRYCFEPAEADVLPKLVGDRLKDWRIG